MLSNDAYKSGRIKLLHAEGNPNPQLNEIVAQGYELLKKYYDTLKAEGRIHNDQLKIILLGNSTAGKTSLVRYWYRKEFSEQQTTTQGITTEMVLPLPLGKSAETFRVNIWDFGGQDYYHATHRLFITRDSTCILVCNRTLEDKLGQEMTIEYMEVDGKVEAIPVLVQHYPYRFWLQMLAFLTKAGKIDDHKNRGQDKSRLPKLFLVENKCGTYKGRRRMRLNENLVETLPFEVIEEDFFHLDVREASEYKEERNKNRKARIFSDEFDNFEEQLIKTLQAQISDNRYEVHKNYPVVRDLLALMAAYRQNQEISAELNQFLVEKKIAPIEKYENPFG